MHKETEGINIYVPCIDKDVTDKIHDQGGFVGVWWSRKWQVENEEMYDLVMRDAQVDVFYSDEPIKAMQYRD